MRRVLKWLLVLVQVHLSKRRRSDSSSCSPLSVTARRLLVARCAREGTLVTHPSSWRPEIQSVHETVAARYSGLRLEESKEQQWIVVREHRRRTGTAVPGQAVSAEYLHDLTEYKRH